MEIRSIKLDETSVEAIAYPSLDSSIGIARGSAVKYRALTKDGRAVWYLGLVAQEHLDRLSGMETPGTDNKKLEVYRAFSMKETYDAQKKLSRTSRLGMAHTEVVAVPAGEFIDKSREGLWYWLEDAEEIK